MGDKRGCRKSHGIDIKNGVEVLSLFTKILNKEIASEIIFENELVFAIKDITPKAPIHLLIIPKKEIDSLQNLKEEDFFIANEMIKAVQLLAKKYGIEKGYRLVVNNGKGAGQTIFHLHFHLLGGKTMTEDL